MARRRGWINSDAKKLIDNYHIKTIQELMTMFPGRSQESINNKIKRLKAAGKISGGKEDNAVKRAYDQRGQDVFFTVDQVK
jgi:hypothetical protein